MELVFILVLILLNGFFAMAEIAIVSVRKLRLQHLASKGSESAKIALDLHNDPNRFLSTIQIGITLIGVLAGAVGGKTLAEPLAGILSVLPIIGPSSGNIALAIIVAGITYVSLILGELVPKHIALHDPEKISLLIARPMNFLLRFAGPVVSLLTKSTSYVMGLLRFKPAEEPPITQDEIKILVEQATKAGVFEKVEQDIVERVLRLSDRNVEDIMTPRSEMVWINIKEDSQIIKKKIVDGTRSRYPVCNENIDKVLGIVHVKDLLYESITDSSFDIKKHLQPPIFIPEHLSIFKLLEHFKESGTHMAFALDEYGVIQGVVTLNDVLEEIVGDIPTIEDVEEPLLVKRKDGSYLADGLLPIDKFKKHMKVDKLPGEDTATYHTLGGYIMSHLGKVPELGHSFEWNGLKFEVMDVDGKRIDKVLISKGK